MWLPLLKKLELCARLRATKAEWRQRLGDEIFQSPALSPFLKITDGAAEALPCSRMPGCGGFHEVRELSGGKLVAVSTDEDRPCASFAVRRVDLAVYRFDLDALLREVAETLTVNPHVERLEKTLVALGSSPNDASPSFSLFPPRSKITATTMRS